MSFSNRVGLTKQKEIQFEQIDNDLKISLWNTYKLFFLDMIKSKTDLYLMKDHSFFNIYSTKLWMDFYKKEVDLMPPNIFGTDEQIKKEFFQLKWNQIFDFIEFNVNFLSSFGHTTLKDQYIPETNRVLEREFSGYRIINDVVAAITDRNEMKAIEEATNSNKFQTVSIHMKTALEKLSDKINPDYRNSVKESISGVETLCRELTGENTLGNSLKKFESKGHIFNAQFKEALENLYAYTNNKSTGIRHALINQKQTPTFDEAKFMLVTCSALINYLISINNTSKLQS